MSKNVSRLSGRKGVAPTLFERLRDAPANELPTLAAEYHVGTSTLYGARTFYDLARSEDKQVFVCNGSACLCAGTQDALRARLGERFPADAIGEVTCLGRCYEGAAFHFRGANYSGEDVEHLEEIVGGTPAPREGPSRVHAIAGADLLIGDYPLARYRQDIAAALVRDRSALLAEIKASGLRGRGGAGFPAGIKWQTCMETPSPRRFVVCNGDEGDPGAYSDLYLLEHQCLKVIAGMVICGYIVGAEYGVIYVRHEYPQAVRRCQETIARLEREGLLGDDIAGTGVNFRMTVVEGAGAYICGEETSLIASLEGRRPEVDVRPPFPAQAGLFQQPTVVNNVETFAPIPWIVDAGGAAYARMGTSRSTGTKLISLDRGFNRPGIYELTLGTPLATLIREAGGFREPVKALHIGGPLGGLVPAEWFIELRIALESFEQHGFLLGHGGVVTIPQRVPIVEYLAHLFEFTAAESCGKCFPCRLGSVRGAEMLRTAINGGARVNGELLNDLLDTLETGSLCALGGGLPLPVRNALHHFRDELETSIEFKP